MLLASYKGAPIVLLILGVLVVGYGYVMRNAVFGRHIYAIGGNLPAAKLSGVKDKKVTFLVFLNMGVLAALAGLVFAARLNAASPKAGLNFELEAIASSFIGGASMSGGVGTVLGAIIGGLVLGVLNNGMNLVSVGTDWQQVIKGLVLLAAVGFDVWNKRKSVRKSARTLRWEGRTKLRAACGWSRSPRAPFRARGPSRASFNFTLLEPLHGTEQTHGHRGSRGGGRRRDHARHGGTAHATGGRTPVKKLFGKLADGTKVYRWSLANGGTRLKVLSCGGIVQSLEIPDRRGRYANVSLGFDNLEDYVAKTPYFGALIGRYGNRIAKGQFTLDGKSYQLSVNDGAQQPARRRPGLRQARVGRRAVHQGLRRRPAPALHERRRRDGLPGHAQGEGDVHPHPARRLAHRLRGHHRQGHRRQPHQPRVLEPGRRGQRHASRTTS